MNRKQRQKKAKPDMYYARAICQRVNPACFGADAPINPVVTQAAIEWDTVLASMLPGSGADMEQRQFFVNACYGAGIGIGTPAEANLAYVLANIPGYTRKSDPAVVFGDDDDPGFATRIGPTTPAILQNTQAPLAQQAQAEIDAKADALQYAHDHPFANLRLGNPLGLPPGQGPQTDPNTDPTKKMLPWVKGALIIGGIGVAGYAMGQVANVGHVIRGR